MEESKSQETGKSGGAVRRAFSEENSKSNRIHEVKLTVHCSFVKKHKNLVKNALFI